MLHGSDTPSAPPKRKRPTTSTPDDLIQALRAELTTLRETLPESDAKAHQALMTRRLLGDIADRSWTPQQAYELETDLGNLRAALGTAHLDAQKLYDLLWKEIEVGEKLNARIGDYEPHYVIR